MINLAAYFNHIKEKTYIDKYPQSIIKLDELKDSTFLEIGSGRFNDAKFLLERGIIDIDSLYLCEPYVFQVFCELVDRIDGMFGDNYSFRNRHHICHGRIHENEFPDNFSDFVYANNVFHALGYKTLEDELTIRQYEALSIQSQKLPWALLAPKQKIKEIVKDIYRMLKVNGILFGRTLSDEIDINLLKKLEAKKEKSEEEKFAILTARAVLEGELIGISPTELESCAKEAGFRHTYTEEKHTWKPRRNFYFRFKK
jgi:hypothetical protein